MCKSINLEVETHQNIIYLLLETKYDERLEFTRKQIQPLFIFKLNINMQIPPH